MSCDSASGQTRQSYGGAHCNVIVPERGGDDLLVIRKDSIFKIDCRAAIYGPLVCRKADRSDGQCQSSTGKGEKEALHQGPTGSIRLLGCTAVPEAQEVPT
ncbi:hypothetical protein E4U22_007000 [Claviceps purpurea]|nr:hypothetical protein E4U22_007000 [Claviceps purpurea]